MNSDIKERFGAVIDEIEELQGEILDSLSISNWGTANIKDKS